MIRHDNEFGSVNVSTSVYTDIVGNAATHCFGVKGMAEVKFVFLYPHATNTGIWRDRSDLLGIGELCCGFVG